MQKNFALVKRNLRLIRTFSIYHVKPLKMQFNRVAGEFFEIQHYYLPLIYFMGIPRKYSDPREDMEEIENIDIED